MWSAGLQTKVMITGEKALLSCLQFLFSGLETRLGGYTP